MNITDTLILQDRMSQTLNAVRASLDNASAATLAAKNRLDELRNSETATAKEITQATKEWAKQSEAAFNLQRKLNSLEKAQEDLNDAMEQSSKASKKSTSMFVAIGSAAGTLAANLAIQLGQSLRSAVGEAINLASDLVEVQNVVDVTFGESAEIINQWSRNALTQFGLNELSAKKYTSTLGAMMKSSGITGDELVEMSTKMAGLAGDMASFYNLDPDEAFAKIRSGISGESEPLKQIGIDLTEAGLQADLMAMGLGKSTAKLTQQQKVLVRYHSILRQTADSQGDFARTAFTFANQQRIFEQNWKKLSAALAEGFLPALTLGYILLNRLINVILNLMDTAKELINKAIEPMVEAFIVGLAGIATYASVSFGIFVARAMWAATTNAALWLWSWAQTLWVTRQVIAANVLAAAQSALAWVKGIPGLLRYQATLLRTAITSRMVGNLSFGAALKAAAGWALANLPLFLTIAVVGLLIYAFVKMNKTVKQVLDFCIDKFFDFGDACLGVLRNIAEVIDRIFHTDLTKGVDSLMEKSETARKKAKEGTASLQKWLDNVGKTNIMSNISNKMGLEKFAEGGALKTKQQGAVELKEEDVKMLSELATRDFMIRYQTLSPSINFGNVTVNENADIGQMINEINSSAYEMANNSLKTGVGK